MRPEAREALRKQLTKTLPYGKVLLEFLDVCRLGVTRIEQLNAGDLAVHLELSKLHKDAFGLQSDEILLACLTHRNQYQWFHREIRERLRKQERLDRGAALVVSPDPDIKAKCADPKPDPGTGYLTTLIAFTVDEVRRSLPSASYVELRHQFQRQAFSVDYFSVTTPVIGDDLFGRAPFLAQLESDLLARSVPLGIFGLRRAGKTSVLNQLLRQLEARPGSRTVIALADLQRENYHVSGDGVALSFARALAQGAREMGSSFRDEASRTPFDRVAALIRHIVKKGAKAVLAIDEVEWLIPRKGAADESQRARDFLEVFGKLRGFKHEFKRDLEVVCCGINQTFAEMPTVGGYPNPVLDFFEARYVAGLEQTHFRGMIERLGSRMGIAFQPDALALLFRWFGGHPYFARQFCGLVSKSEKHRPLLVTLDMMRKYYDSFVVDKHGLIEQVFEHFSFFYPREHKSLVAITRAPDEMIDTLGSRHLEDYGLAERTDNGSLRLRIEFFRRYLLDLNPGYIEDAHAANRFSDRLPIIKELGSGAQGTVYLARDRVLGEDRAVKAFADSVSERQVRAEFELLRSVRSRFVTQAYDLLKNGQGEWYMVMEYVQGETLERILTKKGRLSDQELHRLSYNLFASIESIHPQIARLKQLRDTATLSPFEELDYFRLMNEGYIHRDLKPDNLIVVDETSWEVRLVDLGLAKGAAAKGLSRVGTLDYMAPDTGSVAWDASFDLYALGVILFRSLCGCFPASESADRTGQLPFDARSKRRVRAARFFDRALAPSSADRFHSVQEMREAFEPLVVSAR